MKHELQGTGAPLQLTSQRRLASAVEGLGASVPSHITAQARAQCNMTSKAEQHNSGTQHVTLANMTSVIALQFKDTVPVHCPQMASQRLLPDVSRLLGARLLLPLVVTASLLALTAATAAGGGQAFAVGPGVLLPLCSALLMAFISPLPPQVRRPLSYLMSFRYGGHNSQLEVVALRS